MLGSGFQFGDQVSGLGLDFILFQTLIIIFGPRPQLITINEDNSTSPSPSTTVTTSNQTEFLDLLEDCLKMSVNPQARNGVKSVFVVKQNKPKYDFANASTSSGLGPTKEADSSNAVTSDTGAESSSDLSGTFCSVSLTGELSLDVHEFAAQDFCSKSIVLSTSKLFLITLEGCSEDILHRSLKRTVKRY